ncbi:MAG: trehalose-6-phosphate synthase [Candidatus Bipolaricaulota bacterium]
MPDSNEGKLIVVSNAEPYKHVFGEGDQVRCLEVGGGLTTAMNPQMREAGGLWIAYGRGEADFQVVDSAGKVMVPDFPETEPEEKYGLKRIDFEGSVYENFYRGYANKILWPICHTFPTRADLKKERGYWEKGYLPANEKYAQAVLDAYRPGDTVWIHDYHLAILPGLIRDKIPEAEIGLFWHIPWAPWENFLKIPHDREIIESIMSADLFGLHVSDYVENFFRCVEKLGGEVDRDQGICELDRGSLKVGAHPLGVNYPFFAGADTEKKEEFREEYGAEEIILGVDRQDYSKCIPERIRGFEEFLLRYPDYREQVTLIQRTPESRTEIEEYQIEQDDINREISAFNGKHGTHQWVPIKLFWEGIPQEELIGEYRVADVALITPGIDGMNLVAKEFVAANEKPKALILSEFTGSNRQLEGAITVNPYDKEEVAEAIKNALEMEEKEKKDRWDQMRRVVREQDLPTWAEDFLTDLNKEIV